MAHLMNHFSLLVSFCTGLVHIESAHLQLRQQSIRPPAVLETWCTCTLTVDASRCSLPPFPEGVLLGLLESLECFGLRLSTVLVFAAWPMSASTSGTREPQSNEGKSNVSASSNGLSP